MSQRVKVADAAKEIGCHPQYLRMKMRTGVWDLGKVEKPRHASGQYEYFIFREKLNKFLGLEKGRAEESLRLSKEDGVNHDLSLTY